MSEPQACGNCKYVRFHEHADEFENSPGLCSFPIDLSKIPYAARLVSSSRFLTWRQDGAGCPTWEEKEKA